MNDQETAQAPTPAPAQVIAACGCIGTRGHEYRKPPIVAVTIQIPCPGHPTRVGAGVIERFTTNTLSPYQS